MSRHTDCASQPPLFSAHVVLGLHPVLPLPRAQSGHGPHSTAPGTFTHTVAASHPPSGAYTGPPFGLS